MSMHVQLQKWGNSLAVRIPAAFAKEVSLAQGSEVELTVREGSIVITPRAHWRDRLEALVSQITDENRHAEFDAGPPVGVEQI